MKTIHHFIIPEKQINDLKSTVTVVKGRKVSANSKCKSMNPALREGIPTSPSVIFYASY